MNEDGWKYIMAAEKMESLLFMIDQTMNYLEEYEIQAEDSVRTCLEPAIERISEWMKK